MRGRPGPKRPLEAVVVVFLLDELLLASSIPRRTADWPACSGTCLPRVAVAGLAVAQRVAKHDVVERLVLDQQVRAADGVGLGVVLLAVKRRGAPPDCAARMYSSDTDSMPPVPQVGS